MKKSIFILFAVCFGGGALQGQTKAVKDTIQVKQQTDEATDGRNVMLNAANASEPREISIGLPDGFTYVIDNGLPAVYYYNPLALSTHWRNDLSLEKTSLVGVSEAAITSGHIGYALNSYARLGGDKFKGLVNYQLNQFGQQLFDINVSGPIANDWFYSVSVYQNFDPGSFKLRFTDYNDRAQFYNAFITKVLPNNKGKISLGYKYSNSNRLSLVTGQAPFIYVGDGSVKEYNDFKLGTSSYVPVDGQIYYLDMRDNKYKTRWMNDAALNKSNQVSVISDFNFDGGYKLNVDAKYLSSMASMLYQTPMGLSESSAYRYMDSGEAYSGYVQNRMSCFNRGDFNNLLFTAELNRSIGKHQWRVGLNEWYYHGDYASNTTMYRNTVEVYPHKLMDENGDVYYDFNKNASEFYKGYENKLAAYATHNWDISPKFNLYYGGRLEYYKVKGKNLPYARYDGFHIGGVSPLTNERIEYKDFDHNWLNIVGTIRARYDFIKHFSLHGEFVYNTQRPRLENFSSTENPSTTQIKIPMFRGGIGYTNDWVEATSMFTWIQKKNNYTRLNLIDPADNSNVVARAFNFDIETYAWVTDAVMKPFKNFDLHLMFTYQKPKYKKYATEAFGQQYNFTGNVVIGVPEVLIEIDPSYKITDKLKGWLSFRYFSKTYANLSNALYFNGRWETFGGFNYEVNKYLTLNCTVVNFLNQTGAKGSIDGAELLTKEELAKDPEKYKNVLMTGSYIRPFTVEVSANIKF